MSGFAVMFREAADHPLLSGDASRLGAWTYMVLKCCWKPSKFRIAGKVVELQRGQLCASRAQLAEAWGWSPSAVERFLVRLEAEQMIGRETGQGRTIITVCNYAKYQDISDESGQETGQPSGQDGTRTGGVAKTGQEAGQAPDSANNGNNSTFSSLPTEAGQVFGQAPDSDRTTKEPRNQETKDIPSAKADGRGEPAPMAVDLAATIFRSGLQILCDAGHQEAAARGIIGKWRKNYSTGTVLGVLASCQGQSPAPSNPVEWITKGLQAEQLRAAGQVAYHQGPTDERASVSEIGAELARERAERRLDQQHPQPQKRIANGGR